MLESLQTTHVRTVLVATCVALPLAALALLRVSYTNGPLEIATESVAGFVALLAAFLTLGRATQSRQVRDLILTGALATLGVMNFIQAAVPAAQEAGFGITEAGFIVGTAAFATASFFPTRDFNGLLGSVMLLSIWFGGSVVLVAIVQDAASAVFPVQIASQVTMAVFYSVAFVGFARRGAREDDQFLRWMATAAVLAALARFNYSISSYPNLGLDRLLPGDALQIGFYLLMMIATLYEIVNYWRQRARLIASEERRRIARELHDGLAQELFFIAAKTGILARKNAFEGAVELRDAAARALTESRLAIASLNAGDREHLDVALTREAEGVASRFNVDVDVEMQQGLNTSGDSHAALLRILREAINNAVRHGRASRIKIRLRREGLLHLKVADDGVGFDPAATHPDGFGLISMRERVRDLGGELSIDSVLGSGTVVEAVIP